LTVFDNYRRRDRRTIPVTPGPDGVTIRPLLHLPPEDVPRESESWVSWSTRCNRCPAGAAVILARVIISQHLDWDTFDAASVSQRHLCGHHADAEQADLEALGWIEVAARRYRATPQVPVPAEPQD
jgi:hypothetical protein